MVLIKIREKIGVSLKWQNENDFVVSWYFYYLEPSYKRNFTYICTNIIFWMLLLYIYFMFIQFIKNSNIDQECAHDTSEQTFKLCGIRTSRTEPVSDCYGILLFIAANICLKASFSYTKPRHLGLFSTSHPSKPNLRLCI